MAKILYISVLVLFLILINCSMEYGIINRIGGDITGFNDEYGTIRFYSNDNNDLFTIEALEDTIINGIIYKEIFFNFERMFFASTDNVIFQRFGENEYAVNVPFLFKVFIDGNTYIKNETANNYSYSFKMKVDSLIDFKIYKNAYFVSTELILIQDSTDTLYNEFIITNKNGIVGIKRMEWFVLDSIVKP